MAHWLKYIIYPVILLLLLPDTDGDIRTMLKDTDTITIIEGALEAGKSGKDIFVPLLFKDSNNSSVSTSLHIKGYSVYTECMYSLQDILHVKPPHKFGNILEMADLTNIRFYTVYWNFKQSKS